MTVDPWNFEYSGHLFRSKWFIRKPLPYDYCGLPTLLVMISARQVFRKMRGGSQSWLMQCDDNHFYVVKASNNPQGRRTLVNDYLGSKLLRLIEVNTAECTPIVIPEQLIGEQGLHSLYGEKAGCLDTGPHFGSRVPVNPERQAIFDFLPHRLLPRITNLSDFFATFIFDQWASNIDPRQAVFYRARGSVDFVATMIDNGRIFCGHRWCLKDLPIREDFWDEAYRVGASQQTLDRTIHLISCITEDTIATILREIPALWLAGDMEELLRLVDSLFQRRRSLRALVEQHVARWIDT